MYKMDASIPPPQKRQRKCIFSIGEINTLSEEVEANMELLNSKFTNSLTNQKKVEVWRHITSKVNAVGTAERTVEEVRNKWRNMCREAKVKLVEHKRNQVATGGGPQPPPLSQTDLHVLDIFTDSTSFHGISGGMDVGLPTEAVSAATSLERTWDTALRRATEAAGCGQEQLVPTEVASSGTTPSNQKSDSPRQQGANHSQERNSSGRNIVQNENLPTISRPMKKKKKITSQDVTELQYKVLQKENTKLDLQIQLLKKLNATDNSSGFLASEIFASFS